MNNDINMEVPAEKEKRDLPTDSPSQKTSGNKRKKKMNSVSSNSDTQSPSKPTPKEKKTSKPKKTKNPAPPTTDHITSDVFDFNDIAGNKEASAFIHELVKCYTGNSLLAPEKLLHLNHTLYEKTVSVFITVLNNCVKKILDKVLKSEYFKELLEKEKVSKRSVWCQTDVSYESEKIVPQ